MDYAKLLKPYSDPVEGEPTRTPEGQRKWLVDRHRIPEDVADLAMATIYAGLLAGQTYTGGHALDRAILAKAEAIRAERQNAAVTVGRRQYEAGARALYQARRRARAPRQIARHPIEAARWYWPVLVAYALGGLTVGAVWLLTLWG